MFQNDHLKANGLKFPAINNNTNLFSNQASSLMSRKTSTFVIASQTELHADPTAVNAGSQSLRMTEEEELAFMKAEAEQNEKDLA